MIDDTLEFAINSLLSIITTSVKEEEIFTSLCCCRTVKIIENQTLGHHFLPDLKIIIIIYENYNNEIFGQIFKIFIVVCKINSVFIKMYLAKQSEYIRW